MSSTLPPKHPAYKAHFTDRIYSDTRNPLAPFGNDEGYDVVHYAQGSREKWDASTTVLDILADPWPAVARRIAAARGGVPMPERDFDFAAALVGAAITLLRMQGHIDDEGRTLTLAALDQLIERHGEQPALLRQREDLASWTGGHQDGPNDAEEDGNGG